MILPFKYEKYEDFKNLSQENMLKIDKWMIEFQEKKNLNKMDDKIILITGECNSLKTSLANFICDYYKLLKSLKIFYPILSEKPIDLDKIKYLYKTITYYLRP